MIDRNDRSAVESGGPAEVSEPAAREPARGVEVEAATAGRTKSEDCATMERVVERANVWLAYQRVIRNKGAAGVDGVTALPTAFFTHMGLVSLVAIHGGSSVSVEPPYAEPHVRWCGRPTGVS